MDGPADGESAFKECSGIQVEHSFFNLRYPFWHDHGLTIRDCELTDQCRAALWYSDHITIEDTKLHGIKALRSAAMRWLAELRYHFPGVWMELPPRDHRGLHRPKRVLHDAGN